MKIILLRHGKPKRSDIWIGRLDIPLSEEGKKEVEAIAKKFEGIKIIYTSPLLRARQTAEIIAQVIDAEIYVVNEFTARDHGEATGKTSHEIIQLFPDGIPGQESLEEVRARAVNNFKEILAKGEDAIIVTHKKVIQELLGWILSISVDNALKFAIDPAHFCEIKYESGKFKVLRVNCM